MSSGSRVQNVENDGVNHDKRTFDVGPENSHYDLDSKDQRSIANRLAAAEKHDDKAESHKTVTDPLAPARSHGNEPSHGAKVDAQLQAEDEEMLRKKNN